MATFRLCNPQIIGSFDDKIKAKDAMTAAHELWSRFAENIVGDIPSYHFTLQNQADGSYSSFNVTENATGKYADFQIASVPTRFTNAQEKYLSSHMKKHDALAKKLKNKNNDKQHGGVIDDSSTSTSASSNNNGGYKLGNFSDTSFSEQNGGAKKHNKRRYKEESSSDDSSDDDDDLLYMKLKTMRDRSRREQMFSYYWYTPQVYNLDTLYALNFVAPYFPYSVFPLVTFK